jgi:hypothetical protein
MGLMIVFARRMHQERDPRGLQSVTALGLFRLSSHKGLSSCKGWCVGTGQLTSRVSQSRPCNLCQLTKLGVSVKGAFEKLLGDLFPQLVVAAMWYRPASLF